MEGTFGNLLVTVSFLSGFASMILYGLYARRGNASLEKAGDWLWGLKGVSLLIASAILVHLIVTHRFEYFYVWNYTSLDLEFQYLVSAFYGGQEGSFMLWVLFGFLVGLILMRKTSKTYKGPVMFVFGLTQVFLLSMMLGWDLFGLKIGASPFRTIAQEMPNAPFIQANPDFVPSDGTGLNDLLKSPYMMIHPPIIFLGFAMMTVPFAFAIASLWKRQYHGWIKPALPWTLAANLSLLTAIFLGGYWAYETLSFGGYWAWDPVENASLVPWLIGTAGIHMMIIQKKSSRAHKGAIFLSILAYVAVVYQTFLTRSGVLADSSVHSFVDLGLYNQLLAFMLVMVALGVGFYLYRYRELPSPEKESKILSREFMTFTGGMLLFILGMVIILGTSSPIIGRLFVENPTPPEIQFYNDWSMPLAMVMAFLTVIGQYLFWQKHDWESLASALITPLLITSVASILSIILGDVRNLYTMIFIFAAWFTVIGNGAMIVDLIRRNARLIGGALSHVGFGALLLGIIASSSFTEVMLDERGQNYNRMVEQGEIMDEQGFPVSQKMEIFELKLNVPKVINNQYMVTYDGYRLTNTPRPGQQQYQIRFEALDGGREFTMYPEVYPMLTNSNSENIEWSVDPDVRTLFQKDIYMYVAGSSYVDQRNRQLASRQNIATAGATEVDRQRDAPGQREAGEPETDRQEPELKKIEFERQQAVEVGPYRFTFKDFSPASEEHLPDSTVVGVRSLIEVSHRATGEAFEVEPLFAVYTENGKSWTYAPPLELEQWDLTLQFTRIFPEKDAIELTFHGLEEEYEEEWVVIVAEKKPFVSIVWIGTFLLMGGFIISIFRHRGKAKDS
ncbi:MAG: cytochrome c biogenesis protein CcsA [Balneolaceae bacterium]